MTDDQKSKCHAIIHTAAAASGGANCVPVPGLGIAADMVALLGMGTALRQVFYDNSKVNAEKVMSSTMMNNKAMAVGKEVVSEGLKLTIKQLLKQQAAKTAGREMAKFIPFAGMFIAGAMGVALTEWVGWQLAEKFDRGEL